MSPELLRVLPAAANRDQAPNTASVVDGPDSEYGLLREVLVASPRNLQIVPCNRVSETALQKRAKRLQRHRQPAAPRPR